MYATSWVLAVSFLVQQPAQAVPAAAADLRQVAASLEAVQVQLDGLGRLDALSATLDNLPQVARLVSLGSLASLAGLATLTDLADERDLLEDPPAAWAEQDPGDSLYRAARGLLNRGRYADAAETFADLIRRYPRSDYTPDAYYWQAFSLYKTGDAGGYRRARAVLDYQQVHYTKASTLGDARALYSRIQGELAKQGDQDARIWVQRHAESASTVRGSPQAGGCSTGDDDDDPRVAALNALLQMDAEAAVPILKQVLARRDACSVTLRRKAVFIISQKRTPDTEDILLAAARTDPDNEVRQQAVFWLSQVGTERAVSALDSILHSATDPEIQKKAIFALSQIHGPRAGQILRDYAESASGSEEAREDAVFWLGQQHSAENAAYLRGLYARVNTDDLKEKVIFSLSQMRSEENTRWLIELAQNEREPVEMRKKALFWAGQSGAGLPELVALYDRMTSQEMKEQLIFVYSQRREPDAVTKLIDIAKHETNTELRKKAVFWLGQSRDPRARQVLLDIISQ